MQPLPAHCKSKNLISALNPSTSDDGSPTGSHIVFTARGIYRSSASQDSGGDRQDPPPLGSPAPSAVFISRDSRKPLEPHATAGVGVETRRLGYLVIMRTTRDRTEHAAVGHESSMNGPFGTPAFQTVRLQPCTLWILPHHCISN